MEHEPQITDFGDIYAVLVAASNRPRYAFMVLQLVADLADRRGHAGPFVMRAGAPVLLRDWLCTKLLPMTEQPARRAALRAIYEERLADLPGLRLLPMPPGVTDSLQYLVLRVNEAQAGIGRDALHERLKRFNIVTRKYFHPLCSEYSCYRHLPSARPENLPNAYRVAGEVMTLPLFGALRQDEVHQVCDAIAYSLRH